MKRAVSRSGNGWKAVVVERSNDVQATLVRQLKSHGFDVAATLKRASHAAVEVRAHKADLLILEIEAGADSVLKSIENLASEFRGLRVIVTAPAADPELILKVLRAGASEFLVRPVSVEELSEALDRVVRSLSPGGTANGELYAVYSGKGGVGSTTVAVNLAFGLARRHPESRVALVDSVTHGGDVQVFLDLNPPYSIADLIQRDGKKSNRKRIDGQLLEKVMQRHPGGVWVLPEPGGPEDAAALRGEHVTEILARLRASFAYCVIDCEHQLTERTQAILDAVDRVLVVAVLNVPAVRQLQRTLELFERLGYPEHKVALVVNRHHKKDVLSVKDVERSLKREVLWRLPNDYRATIDAITRGKPLSETAPRSKLARSFDRLALELTRDGSENGNRSLGARMRDALGGKGL